MALTEREQSGVGVVVVVGVGGSVGGATLDTSLSATNDTKAPEEHCAVPINGQNDTKLLASNSRADKGQGERKDVVGRERSSNYEPLNGQDGKNLSTARVLNGQGEGKHSVVVREKSALSGEKSSNYNVTKSPSTDSSAVLVNGHDVSLQSAPKLDTAKRVASKSTAADHQYSLKAVPRLVCDVGLLPKPSSGHGRSLNTGGRYLVGEGDDSSPHLSNSDAPFSVTNKNKPVGFSNNTGEPTSHPAVPAVLARVDLAHAVSSKDESQRYSQSRNNGGSGDECHQINSKDPNCHQSNGTHAGLGTWPVRASDPTHLLLPLEPQSGHVPPLSGHALPYHLPVHAPPPLPPVPEDMAEAIKRQQKGASGVRYWKSKHLQSNGGPPTQQQQQGLAALKPVRPGGGGMRGLHHGGMFPVLKPPHPGASNGCLTENGGGGGGGGERVGGGFLGLGRNPLGAEARRHRARERMLRQRDKENTMNGGRRSSSTNSHYYHNNSYNNGNNYNSNYNSSSNNNKNSSSYNTHFLLGSSLGYPPALAGYKRSVSTLENLLSLPFPQSSSSSSVSPFSFSPLYANTCHQINPSDEQSSDPILLTQLAQTPPKPASPTSSDNSDKSRHNKPPLDPPNDSRQTHPDRVQGGQQKHRHINMEKNHHHSNNNNNDVNDDSGAGSSSSSRCGSVADLTCLQLADTILSTRTADLSRYYQICQTKIRYVDFLERSALRAERAKQDASASSPQASPRDEDGGRGTGSPDSKYLPDGNPVTASPRGDNQTEGERGKEGGSVRGLGVPPTNNPAVSLPTLKPPPPPSLPPGRVLSLSRGLSFAHGPTPLPVKYPSHLFDASYATNDVVDSGDNNGSDFVSPSSSVAIPRVPLGKPILKPFNHRHNHHQHLQPQNTNHPHYHDPFAPPRDFPAFSGALNVRGATMYPLGTTEAGGGSGEWGTGGGGRGGSRHGERRPRSSTSRREADGKRGVRFSISNQVFEFAPGEPLNP